MDFAGLSHRAFLQKSTPRGSQGKKSEHSFRSSQTAKTNESTTLILHGIPGVGESKKSRGDLANFRSAIRDFSSFCGTLFRDPGFFFVLRNRTGGFFRSKGKISVLRNTVPRSGIFLQFAEQDRRFLPLKRNNLCFAEHSSAIWDFSSVCGTQFRDLGFFFSLRNRTGGFFRSNGKISVLRNIVPRSGIFLKLAEQDRRFLPLKRKNLCFAEHSSATQMPI